VANQGELLRMIGVAPGIDGDTAEWWAATDGYVPPNSVTHTANEWAASWALPNPSEAPHGWWGEVNSASKIHAGPTLQASVVGTLVAGDRVKVLGEEADLHDGDPNPWYRIDGGRYAGGRIYSQRVTRLPDPQPNIAEPSGIALNHWIVVHRPSSTLTLVKDGQPQFTTYVALGKAGLETAVGQYGLIAKYLADDMDSATVPTAERAYFMPNVPFTQSFIDDGSAIHGTYWHDKFGAQESQGCVNLTWNDATYLFEQTRPELAAGDTVIWARGDQRTTILIVD
jgi:lipoprotein-anchoring transpeptidase ErfK/SrfK